MPLDMTGFGENPSTDWTRVLLNIKFNGLNLNNLQELKKNLVSDKNNNTVFHSIHKGKLPNHSSSWIFVA